MKKQEIERKINSLIQEKLFAAIRKIIIAKQREKLINSTEYFKANTLERNEMFVAYNKIWYKAISSFFLSFRSIFALQPLVQRELKIREFTSQEVIRVKADYIYNNIEFSALYPTHYNLTMQKEIEDCIGDLKNLEYSHIVSNYILKNDTERSPHEPLTLAELKYSAFYLYGFRPEYVTRLASLLFKAGLITNPETNGWNINDSIVEDIITLLNKKYPEDIVLQYKRNFTDNLVDRTEQECIRPTELTLKYFPKKIKETREFQSIVFADEVERRDAINVYKFIYYITLSTQMKNSIYDTSILEITAGTRILKAQANELLDGHENWELLSGEVISKISNNSEGRSGHTVVLPEIPQETVLRVLDVYSYSYQSKRPPRYGVGRFVSQILEKNSIGKNREHDEIINNLIDSKAVVLIKTMLYPQESAILLLEWLKEHLPSFTDFEYLYELEDKIESVVRGELTIDSIIEEIDRLIESAFDSSGFTFDQQKPSAVKIKLLKAVALKHNLQLDDSIYQSNVKIDMILARYPMEEPIKIGSCPSCNALVYQREYINDRTGEVSYYFACEKFSRNDNGCKFSIWDSYIQKYFSDKAIELLSVKERADTLKKIASKKRGYLFTGFIGRNKKPYDAKVFLEAYQDRDSGQTKWAFQLKFMNKKK